MAVYENSIQFYKTVENITKWIATFYYDESKTSSAGGATTLLELPDYYTGKPTVRQGWRTRSSADGQQRQHPASLLGVPGTYGGFAGSQRTPSDLLHLSLLQE
ncbi:hypothetical protein Btru_069937 [Bulinus truncatus]|nr:hypothetical protein Btru_069937 [Bulinus truncatus]